MATKADYYDLLGITQSATPDEIKRAYRKQAMRYHPDRNPDDAEAEERFKAVTEAYAILSDPEKRKRYDRMGHAAFSRGGAGGGGGNYQSVDFGAVTEILEGLFGEVFGGARRRPIGRDIEKDVRITFEEAAHGTEKTVRVERAVPCESCEGVGAAPGSKVEACPACGGKGEVRFQRGFFSASRPCSACGGSGKRIREPCGDCLGAGTRPSVEELIVKIPPGVEHGSTRTVRGKGERAKGGEGDLLLNILVEPHPLFTRKDADVLLPLPISFPQAVLGAQVEVPTLEGIVRMRIPAGTQSGRILRLRGKGFPVFGGYGKGDQLVTVLVEVPEKVSRKQRELIEQLAREMGEDSHPQQKSFLDKLKALFE